VPFPLRFGEPVPTTTDLVSERLVTHGRAKVCTFVNNVKRWLRLNVHQCFGIRNGTFDHNDSREGNILLCDNTSSYVKRYSPADTRAAHQTLTAGYEHIMSLCAPEGRLDWPDCHGTYWTAEYRNTRETMYTCYIPFLSTYSSTTPAASESEEVTKDMDSYAPPLRSNLCRL
jgi:hypothetical protein